jgi:hypothetical protein
MIFVFGWKPKFFDGIFIHVCDEDYMSVRNPAAIFEIESSSELNPYEEKLHNNH